MYSGLFSAKNVDVLALFYTFSSFIRLYASTTSHIDIIYILSHLPLRGVRIPSNQLTS